MENTLRFVWALYPNSGRRGPQVWCCPAAPGSWSRKRRAKRVGPIFDEPVEQTQQNEEEFGL